LVYFQPLLWMHRENFEFFPEFGTLLFPYLDEHSNFINVKSTFFNEKDNRSSFSKLSMQG